MNFLPAIRSRLERLAADHQVVLLRTGHPDLLPVFVAARDTAMFLGYASTHAEAQALGRAQGFSCGRSSRAYIDSRPTDIFFILRA